MFPNPAFHLFRVKAEGHYRQNSPCGWVANKLTLLNEVDKSEIIVYYEKNPALLLKLKDKWEEKGESDDLWERYKSL